MRRPATSCCRIRATAGALVALMALGLVAAAAAGASRPKPAAPTASSRARTAATRAPVSPDSATVLALLEGMRNASCPLPGVATGGQPDSAQLAALARAGFRTVVDLRTPEEPRGFDEPVAARARGLAYRPLPIGHDGVVPDSTFDAFRAFMADTAAGPVLVHCASGNRVGPVMIAWLVLDRHWSLERAVDAAKRGGLRTEGLETAARDYIGRHRR